MPHHQAQKKSLRQDAKRHERNRAAKSRIRTLEKKLRSVIKKGDAAEATGQLRDLQKALDQAKSHNLIKAETVSRKKSQLAKHVNALSDSKAA